MRSILPFLVILSFGAFVECASMSSVALTVEQSLNDCTCAANNQKTWTNPNNVITDDGQITTSVLGAGQFSTRLELVFDFPDLPNGAKILGVQVDWKRSASAAGCRDDSMSLIVDGAVVLTSDYCTRVNCNTDWGVNTPRIDTFGGPEDLWGFEELTAEKVKGIFGVAMRTERVGGGGGTRTFSVDAATMTVHYEDTEAASKKKASTIAVAVVVPIVVVAVVAGAVVGFIFLKRKRPDLVHNMRQSILEAVQLPKTRESHQQVADIEVEKGKQEKPMENSEPYKKTETARIGSQPEAESPKAESSASPRRPARPTSVIRNSEKPEDNRGSSFAPSQPYKPSPSTAPYIPSPTQGESYKGTPTRDLSKSSSFESRGSALGSSMDGRSSIFSSQELPAVGKYHKSGKNSFSETLVFGAPIDIVRTKNGVPVAVEDTIAVLERKGYQEEGILRLAGGSQDIKAIKECYDKGQEPDFSKMYDSHSISGALKLYFRELPQRPLLMTKGIKQASGTTDESEFVEIMQKEFDTVPEVNYFTIKRLFMFLNLVASSSHVNRMTPDNLAIVFQPTLQLPKPLIIALINHPEVFTK